MANPHSEEPSPRIAIVGGGLSGLSTAFYLAQAGLAVEVFEAAPILGGRARIVPQHLISENDQGNTQHLDNGPHLILGAYHTFLALIYDAHRAAGLLPKADESFNTFLSRLFFRAPFSLQGNTHTLTLGSGNLWQTAIGTLKASKGFSFREYLALLRLMLDLLRTQITDESVTQWLARLGIPQRLQKAFFIPLCLSALNTDPHKASAAVFRTVLREAFLKKSEANHKNYEMLWAKVDFHTLYINPLKTAIEKLGGIIHPNQRVSGLTCHDNAMWTLTPHHKMSNTTLSSTAFSQVILATPIWQTQTILHNTIQHNAPIRPQKNLIQPLLHYAEHLSTNPIANVMLFLKATPTPAQKQFIDSTALLRLQWFEDIAIIWLNHCKINPLAFEAYHPNAPIFTAIYSCHVPKNVVEFTKRSFTSLCGDTFSTNIDESFTAKLISEKRATHSAEVADSLKKRARYFTKNAETLCLQNIHQTPHQGLWVTGDYLSPDLPATLETAVRSAKQTTASLVESLGIPPVS